MHDKIREKLLAADEEAEERNLAEFIPLMPPNLLVRFTSDEEMATVRQSSHLHGSKAKNFSIHLTEKPKFRLEMDEGAPLSCCNELKATNEFHIKKQEFGETFHSLFKDNLDLVIELPEHQPDLSAHHIINSLFMDLTRAFEYYLARPQENHHLTLHSSIEAGNSINEIYLLRKRR